MGWLLAGALLLAGCQETPETEAVAGKDPSLLESRIQEEGTQASEPAEYQWETVRCTNTFSGAEETVQIRVDAEVRYVANVSPVLRIRPHSFTGEEARRWAECLAPGQEFYEPKNQLTKAEIEQEILEWRQTLADEEGLRQEYGDDPAVLEEVRQDAQTRIGRYEQLYAEAPEQVELRESDWQLHDLDYYDPWAEVSDPGKEEDWDQDECLEAETQGEEPVHISVCNRRAEDYHYHELSFQRWNDRDENGNRTWNAEREEPMAMGREEAQQMVEEMLAQMGLAYMHLSSLGAYGKAADAKGRQRELVEEGEDVYSYSFLYLPSYQGLEMAWTGNTIPSGTEEHYGAVYLNERLTVTVANQQITRVVWRGPSELVAVENLQVQLIPFEEAWELFQRQMQTEYTLGKLTRYSPANADYAQELARYTGGEIFVDQISYGYVRIQIPDNYEEFRLVPAWCFQGEEQLDDGSGISWEDGTRRRQRRVYQTVNAVDGSLIDVNRGY